MDQKTKKTVGGVAAGCGCFLLILMTFWMGFLIYIGLEGRGNDEEISAILAGVTCCFTVPVVAMIGGGLFFALKKPASGAAPE